MTKEMQQERQKESELWRVDLLRYGSEHFYNTTNTEDLLHLKDGEINKMRQFDKKIYKPIPRKPLGNIAATDADKNLLEDGQTITIKP